MTKTSRLPVFGSLPKLLGATALGLLATASSQALAADPIKIGVDGPFTGGSSSMGISMREGVPVIAGTLTMGPTGDAIVVVVTARRAGN